MSVTSSFRSQVVQQLIQVGQAIHEQGWSPATSGNLSVRLDADTLLVSASGTSIGHLVPEDLLDVDCAGHPRDPSRIPSAETLLHTALYGADPTIGAVLHVHSQAATVLSMTHSSDVVVLTGMELLKAFSGIDTHEATLRVPIIDNDQNMAALGAEAVRRLAAQPDTFGVLIRGHGLTTWGRDVASAHRHLQAFDFLFSCTLSQQRITR